MCKLPQHPNIVDMPGMFIDDMLVTEEGLQKFPAAMPRKLNPELHYGRNKTLYLVMRRRNTHLQEYLASSEITMEMRCWMLAQLLEGVAHMGLHGIAHRDLKSDNVLVDLSAVGGVPRLEICDFGCCLAEDNKSMTVPFPTRDIYIGGNYWLMAPEIATATPGRDSCLDFSKSDLWASGAIAYEILGGENPFYPSKGNFQQQLSSRNYHEKDLPALPVGVPGPVKRLIKSLLHRDPKKRPSPTVAATVVQIVALEENESHNQRNHADEMKVISRKQKLCSSYVHGRSSNTVSAAIRKEKQKFSWLMLHSLAMVCQLIFGSQSEFWDIKSVMNFLLLSRLNYADFRAALMFF
jgi:PTEN induced putative kinase 1